MEIDPRFKQARARSAQRRRNAWAVPLVIWGGGFAALAVVVAALFFGGVLRFGAPKAPDETAEAPEAAGSAYVSAFVDLAGDPMRLRFDVGAAEKTKPILRPIEIPAARAANELSVLTDELITGEEALITTIPSSREDFAYFQAQKTLPSQAPKPQQMVPATTQGETVVVEGDEAGWGDNVEGQAAGPVTYVKTVIEDTTSVNLILPEAQRAQPYQDTFLRLKDTTNLTELMTEAGMNDAAAARFSAGAAILIPEFANLKDGYILAMRAANRSGMMVPVQASLYTKDTYFGSIALSDAGKVVTSADPWVEEDLFSYAGDKVAADADVSRKYRMLDAFYSAAIRNGVPSAVVAETIVMMSQSFDMESFAAPGDKMTLIYSKDPGSDGPGPGQVLYASIKGEGKVMECNVYKMPNSEDYACFGPGGSNGSSGGGGGVRLRAGFVTPTQGVLTSRFGPRMHPILKVVKVHNGTDWAAPVGTPIVAAFAGTILFEGDGGTYGNLIKISHPGGIETRYAHMSAFADGVKQGDNVTAGELIGYIGTTGRSTGPHLHFEFYENGVAEDPLTGDDAAVADGGGSAVEVLVDQIIRVESGGKADAANPNSTAVGLGQFVEGTWIMMMNKYRPDLASTMDRAALLALRTDPTLSREMVTALAREGESYLRARGHEITAGRLYLCHFLGAEGANRALNATDDQMVIDVMGASVVSANGFLVGKTIGDLKQWAENKMNSKGGGSLPAVAATPPEVLAYQKIIAGILASLPT